MSQTKLVHQIEQPLTDSPVLLVCNMPKCRLRVEGRNTLPTVCPVTGNASDASSIFSAPAVATAISPSVVIARTLLRRMKLQEHIFYSNVPPQDVNLKQFTNVQKNIICVQPSFHKLMPC